MTLSTNDSWRNACRRQKTPNNLARTTPSHFLLNFFVPLLLHFHMKRVSKTSSDSGVKSRHVLSPAMPTTPDTSQSDLMPSTSRMYPPSRPLTSIQQFIKNSQKSKTKEPKYNRSQADHPDSQTMRRTRTRQGYKL